MRRDVMKLARALRTPKSMWFFFASHAHVYTNILAFSNSMVLNAPNGAIPTICFRNKNTQYIAFVYFPPFWCAYPFLWSSFPTQLPKSFISHAELCGCTVAMEIEFDKRTIQIIECVLQVYSRCIWHGNVIEYYFYIFGFRISILFWKCISIYVSQLPN